MISKSTGHSGVSIFPEKELRQFAESVFVKMGCTVTDAGQASDVLLAADLRGVDSHGVARLPGYVRLWDAGRVSVKPEITVVHQTPSTAGINAGGALGLVSAPWAMDLAIKKAEEVGSSVVTVSHSNHYGIAAYHAMRALPHNMIGWSMSNASPLVVPTGGRERMLGTNPMCWAFPAGRYPAVVVDTATSAASNGKLEIAERKGEPIPAGWAVDHSGEVATHAHVLREGGSLLPLGSVGKQAGHKGYALGSVVDLLSGVLSGAGFGPWVPPFVSFLPMPENPPGHGIGHIFGAIRVDAFRIADQYFSAIDRWIERFKCSEPVNEGQPVLVPGEPELQTHEYRLLKGIPLTRAVADQLYALADRWSLSRPIPLQ
jgi:LDH2 family malate/lactate/ureidoglycolate dehydrogenase